MGDETRSSAELRSSADASGADAKKGGPGAAAPVRPVTDAFPIARSLGIDVPLPQNSVWYDEKGCVTEQCLRDHRPLERAMAVEEGTAATGAELAEFESTKEKAEAESKVQLENRFKRIQQVDGASLALARSHKGDEFTATWRQDVLLKGEEEIITFETTGFIGMPSTTPGVEMPGTGKVMLTRIGDKHRLHFYNRSEISSIRAHEAWSHTTTTTEHHDGDGKETEKSSSTSSNASGNYNVERSANLTSCNINVEGNVFHVDCQIDREATLAMALGGGKAQASAWQAKPKKGCCDDCCDACCGDCGCVKCITCPCWFPALCLKFVCCNCVCFTCCCKPGGGKTTFTQKTGVWDFAPPAFMSLNEAAKNEESITEETSMVDIQFPDGCTFSGEQRQAGKVKAVHCVHIFYRNPASDSVVLCTAKLSPDAPLAQVNRFVSELGVLCEAPDATLSDRKKESLLELSQKKKPSIGMPEDHKMVPPGFHFGKS